MSIALDRNYLDQLSRMPAEIQRRANNMLLKFMDNQASRGLNLEKLKGGSGFYSLRVQDDYRVILKKADANKQPIFVYIDTHDKAYRWAETHKCEVHPETGTVQIFNDVTSSSASGIMQLDAVVPNSSDGMFRTLKDRQLRRLGVPSQLVNSVRSIRENDESAFINLEGNLPDEAYEALLSFYLQEESYDDLVNRLETPPETVDPNDFDAALERVTSRSQFVVIENNFDLEAILNQPLAKWRVFLHPDQHHLVERHWNGPVRVLGSAGTGKTVVALHRARYLARQIIAEGRGKSNRNNDKILFVTFVNALKLDIEESLKSLCNKEEMSRITVTTLDSWVRKYIRRKGFKGEVQSDTQFDALWARALRNKPKDLDFSDDFLTEELEQVVLERNALSERDYFAASRIGRDRGLSRIQRAKIWPIFDQYLALMRHDDLKSWPTLYYDAINFLVDDQDAKYRAVIADEVQDFESFKLRLLRALTPEKANDMFLVGDGHQRIYLRRPVAMSQFGINIRGRGRKLRINYRTTKQIRQFASRMLTGNRYDDLDGKVDSNSVIRSMTTGAIPEIVHHDEEERHWGELTSRLGQLRDEGVDMRNVCVVGRTNHITDRARNRLVQIGIQAKILPRNEVDAGSPNIVRCATAHRIKGLEFDYIFLVGCNQDVFPPSAIYKNRSDREQIVASERSLLYVTTSRAKRALVILSYAERSPLLVEALNSKID